ncbi:AraC family transcriptional regulator [Pseudomonas sp. Fl4BN1]|uniref:AraC family transcriptional regulator n=1 Tax=Pseudomonas sp. Fl4BN1 TaxID=2697651 RepID=UPI001378CAC7|nr:helix-turn-helix transcriptional regulator [Pseudomonas sp. Fl4BN1]NBF13260.1 helix-turn-helix domain-containing protein [Pseudomonas sp. Fl4BN1]
MPVFEEQEQVHDPDAIARALSVLHISTQDRRWERPWHSHRKAQLLFPLSGVISCESPEGLWLAAPQCAVWVPSGVGHSVQGLEHAQGYCLFVEPEHAAALPEVCCTLAVSPLLQELFKRCAQLPALYDLDGAEGRLMAVALDELSAAPREQIHLPMPQHAQLRRLAQQIIERPEQRCSLNQWGALIGLSERSLSRLILSETGLSFGRWQRQLHILQGLKQLGQGDSVERVALTLGYDSASAFIRMFKKAVGQPPGQFFAERGQRLKTDTTS